MFITAVYAILTLDSGELVYANAGHNLPLLFTAKDRRRSSSCPRAARRWASWNDLKLVDHVLTIQPGDALVLFTDGVTDLNSPEGEFFGDKRLQQVIREHGKEHIQDILEALDDALIEFRRGVPPADDVTLLAIRREPARRAHRKKADPPE